MKPNAADIAAGNIALTLAQVVIDVLIRERLFDYPSMKRICEQLLAEYSGPSIDPERTEIRSAAIDLTRILLAKYDVPPKSQHN